MRFLKYGSVSFKCALSVRKLANAWERAIMVIKKLLRMSIQYERGKQEKCSYKFLHRNSCNGN